MKTFEDFLADKHAEQYQGLDDEMPDDCDDWMGDLTADELIEYGEKYGKEVRKEQIEKDAKICERIKNLHSNPSIIEGAGQCLNLIRNQKL